MTVKKNYESYAQHLKDEAKKNPEFGEDQKESRGHKNRFFAYYFAIIDLDSWRNISFGSSMRSKREAYDRAMDLLAIMRIHMDSIRLDRYYSSTSYMDKLGEMKVFVIP